MRRISNGSTERTIVAGPEGAALESLSSPVGRRSGPSRVRWHGSRSRIPKEQRDVKTILLTIVIAALFAYLVLTLLR